MITEQGEPILQNADLNDYFVPGIYSVNNNTIAATGNGTDGIYTDSNNKTQIKKQRQLILLSVAAPLYPHLPPAYKFPPLSEKTIFPQHKEEECAK